MCMSEHNSMKKKIKKKAFFLEMLVSVEWIQDVECTVKINVSNLHLHIYIVWINKIGLMCNHLN